MKVILKLLLFENDEMRMSSKFSERNHLRINKMSNKSFYNVFVANLFSMFVQTSAAFQKDSILSNLIVCLNWFPNIAISAVGTLIIFNGLFCLEFEKLLKSYLRTLISRLKTKKTKMAYNSFINTSQATRVAYFQHK